MINMKIEINTEQPLDDVVRELERLGYVAWRMSACVERTIVTWEDGTYSNFLESVDDPLMRDIAYKLTTLQQLREMK